MLIAVFATEIVLLVRRRDWGRLRLPALALTLGASILSTWTLRPEFVTTSTDWSFGTSSWLAVVLLFNRPVMQLICFLSLHELVTVLRSITLPELSDGFILNLVAGSVGTLGFPLACGIASTALRGVAERAEHASAQAADIRRAEAIATSLHETRYARLAQLEATTEPLLQGLADGQMSPADPAVRRACAVEAAHLRRLLAETDHVDDPVVHELRHGADVAQRKGVLVELERVGAWGAPGLEVRRALISGPLTVLAQASTTARVCIIGTSDCLSVNVVADGDQWQVPQSNHPHVEYAVVPGTNTIWMEARWVDRSPSS
jgi:hypothetical protein